MQEIPWFHFLSGWTLFNESEDKVLYMCSFGREDKRSLQVLEAGQQNSWNFTQFTFPLHWCYLYVNDKRHGFFWAYGVKSRCIKCFWKVGKHPFLYRSDQNRWERQQLFPPLNLKFNLTLPGGSSSWIKLKENVAMNMHQNFNKEMSPCGAREDRYETHYSVSRGIRKTNLRILSVKRATLPLFSILGHFVWKMNILVIFSHYWDQRKKKFDFNI